MCHSGINCDKKINMSDKFACAVTASSQGCQEQEQPVLRAAGYHQQAARSGWIPALRGVRLVVPGKILINSFIYEEPK